MTKYSYGYSRLSWRLLLGCASLLSAAQSRGDSPEGIDFFEKKIRPVLVAKCYGCHSAEAEEVKGGLLLDTRDGIRKGGELGPAVVPGKESESLLLEAIRYQNGLEMPPDGRLDAGSIEDFSKWIAMGAPDPRDGTSQAVSHAIDIEAGRKHWAYQPVAAPPAPATEDADWSRSDIDRFILADLEAQGLRPVADAAPLDLLRRISYDLTGLPPEPELISSFTERYGQDPSGAVVWIVDELLNSPRFGERWGRHWLDLARYAESNGGADNVLVALAPRYRDYVIDAFNADKPYDQFVQEQLAGDLMTANNDAQRNEQLIATGFLALGVKDLRERNGHRLRMAIVEEQIDVVGRAFLGQTIACAKCHDHKFDPIPTSDYYALAGVFYSSQLHMGVNHKSTSYLAGLVPLAGSATVLSDRDVKTLRKESLWATKRSIALRDEKHRLLREAGLLKARPRQQDEFLKNVSAIQEALAAKQEQDAKLAVIRDRFQAAMRTSAIAVQDAKPEDLAVHIRGEDSQLGPIVPRGFPQVLVSESSPRVNREQSGRLELAQWIASKQNPLTARVMVNRLWQHLMGEGLVKSPDNFGTTGQPPSNPGLLEHLAERFVTHQWSVKSMIREIMLSRVYQLSADHEKTAYQADPGNQLHWRMNRRRLSSDALFDSLLFVSGELELGRPPERFPIKDGDQRLKSFDRQGWLEPVAFRRTVYQPIFREYISEDWNVFDFPDPELLMGQRDVTTVPTQALYLMNSPFVAERSQALARRINSALETGADVAAIEQAYLRVLGRSPSEQEAADGRQFLQKFNSGGQEPNREKAFAMFCQALFASAEFRYTY